MIHKKLFLTVLLVVLGAADACRAMQAFALDSPHGCNPRAYGAKGDGVTKDTAAIQSAIDAVSRWKYKPYYLNGEPVEVDTTINVVFTLGG